MEDRMLQLVDETLERTIKDGLTTNNLDIVYKLSKIKYYTKEAKEMNNYGNYGGRRPGYDTYGRDSYGNYENYGNYGRGSYGARGRDMRYRGDDSLDRMAGEYGRYEEGRRSYREGGNYGAKEDSMKSLKYMLEATVDFFKMLNSEAESQEEKQLIRQYAQQLTQM